MTEKPLSSSKLYGLLTLFILFGIMCLLWPIYSTIELINTIALHNETIIFDKGVYYAFGVGLLFAPGPIWILYLYMFRNKNSEKVQRYDKVKEQRIQRNAYLFFACCLAITFILPQIVSISVGQYLEQHGYIYCDKLSTQWLHARTMVYTKNECN
jgi:hypothetical protein